MITQPLDGDVLRRPERDEDAVTGVRQTPGLIGVTDDGFRSRRYFANVLAPRRAGVRLRYTLQ